MRGISILSNTCTQNDYNKINFKLRPSEVVKVFLYGMEQILQINVEYGL